MANHKSALKRARQSETRRLRNRLTKTKVRNALKATWAALETKADNLDDTLKNAMSVLAKAAGKGVLHRRNVARRIGRLSQKVAAAKAQPQA